MKNLISALISGLKSAPIIELQKQVEQLQKEQSSKKQEQLNAQALQKQVELLLIDLQKTQLENLKYKERKADIYQSILMFLVAVFGIGVPIAVFVYGRDLIRDKIRDDIEPIRTELKTISKGAEEYLVQIRGYHNEAREKLRGINIEKPIDINTAKKVLESSESGPLEKDWAKAIIYYFEDDYDNALALFKELSSKYFNTLGLSDVASIYFYISFCFYEKGDYNNALLYLDSVLCLNPNDEKVWSNKGLTLAKLGKYEETKKSFDKAIEINPNNEIVWYNKGSSLVDLGKSEEALKFFEKSIEINPNYEKTWLNKGLALADLGKHDDAIEAYDKAIKINPNNEYPWYNKGNSLAKLDKPKEALEAYDKAIKINPNNENAWCNKGNALVDLGKHEEALKCYNKVIKINPNHEIVWHNKGNVLTKKGKYKEALECANKALSIKPDNASVKKLKKLIEEKMKQKKAK